MIFILPFSISYLIYFLNSDTLFLFCSFVSIILVDEEREVKSEVRAID